MATDEDDDIPESGAVFTFGKTKFADNLANKFWIRNDPIVHVSCGDEHSAVITESGRLYTFGSNDWGQLGHGNTKSYTKPSLVKKLKPEKSSLVACGRNHTVVATESGKLFTFGAGSDGQLGHGNNEGSEIPLQLETIPAQLFKSLSCGSEHTAALAENGLLYVWGSGSEGQTGLETTADTNIPTVLTFPQKILHVACGYYHTAIVTVKGELYTFGESDGGKLGLEKSQLDDTTKPQHVSNINEPIVGVACGGSHTVAFNSHGQIFTFGEGEHGQLGHDSSCLYSALPKVISRLKKKRIKFVSCGENHTAAITLDGQLHMFGDGRHGKLCMGDENFSNLFKTTRVQRFKNFEVQKVSCGGCHTLVVAVRKDKADESEESEEESTLQSSFSSSKGNIDSADGPEVNTPKGLSATVPVDGLSPRDKRRQRELKSSDSLGGSFPVMNRSALPPLPGLSTPKPLPALSKTYHVHEQVKTEKANPLNITQLPRIEKSKDGKLEEVDGLNTHLKPIPLKRGKMKPLETSEKSDSASDSGQESEEDDEEEDNKAAKAKEKETTEKEKSQKTTNAAVEKEDESESESEDETDSEKESNKKPQDLPDVKEQKLTINNKENEKLTEKSVKKEDDEEEESESEEESETASDEESDEEESEDDKEASKNISKKEETGKRLGEDRKREEKKDETVKTKDQESRKKEDSTDTSQKQEDDTESVDDDEEQKDGETKKCKGKSTDKKQKETKKSKKEDKKSPKNKKAANEEDEDEDDEDAKNDKKKEDEDEGDDEEEGETSKKGKGEKKKQSKKEKSKKDKKEDKDTVEDEEGTQEKEGKNKEDEENTSSPTKTQQKGKDKKSGICSLL